MRLLKGNIAPQFEMVALSGKTVTLNPPKDSLKAYVGKQNVPFEIIPDPDQKLYKYMDLKNPYWEC